MRRPDLPALSRRERQIMDILLRLGSASASDVRAELPDPPSYSAVRTMLSRLEEKGHVSHEQDGPRYLYRAAIDADRARESALERTVRTFFEGSPGKTVAALLDRSSTELSDAELGELAEMIERIRRERS
ncbi:MAG: BlaI/MecI/CopY family transcriptional regulator [Gemmatimonadota bacterium]|nr:BlaI/MecI/CopY family transcriptional regulator [Gemmatimonadota bacterium]